MFLEFAGWLQSSGPSLAIQTVQWIVPLTQSLHIATIGIVLVSIVMLALRVLGAARTDEPLEDVARRFAPWLAYGLAIMAATGIVLVVGEPLRQFTALSFWLKMALLVVGVASGAAFLRSLRAGARRAGPDGGIPRSTKSAAVATVVLWVCIVYLGRAIAYDVEMWGSHSLAAAPAAAQTPEAQTR